MGLQVAFVCFALFVQGAFSNCQAQKSSLVILHLIVTKAIIITGANSMNHVHFCLGKIGSLEIIQKAVP